MARSYALDLDVERQRMRDAGAPSFCLPCGLDEAGRGPLAGPVVAAAVILPQRFYQAEQAEALAIRLTDSKKLSERQREAALAWVQRHCFWAVSGASAREIDQINILQASLLAMRRAPAQSVVKGDALCPSIAAASVLAKVLRDRAMQRLAHRYPIYGFDGHKGYPTAAHKAAISAAGVSPHHRLSFGDLATYRR